MRNLARTTIALAATIVLAAGCGSDDEPAKPDKKVEKDPKAIVDPNEIPPIPDSAVVKNEPATPETCLKLAKLSAVRMSETDTWMGTDLATGGTIRLVKFATPAAAADALAGAKKEKAAINGRYVAFGAPKAADKVAEVAGCAATIAE